VEAQGEIVNNQKMLTHQILSKFPLEVMLKLEDIKEYGRKWTVKELRRLLSQYIQVQESVQQHFSNCKGAESRAVRYGISDADKVLLIVGVTARMVDTHLGHQWKSFCYKYQK